jgi:predicted HAD superfamily Cof-like phosphohydrolase
MSNKSFTEQVMDFHRAFDLDINYSPINPDEWVYLLTLRATLIAEEYKEVMHALGDESIAAIAKNWLT